MWKMLVGFVIFAALALFIMTKSGGNIDMGGEKHEVAAPHAEASAPVDTAAAAAASAPASAASN